MIFYEKLRIKWNIDQLRHAVDTLHRFADPLQSTEAFGGWALQSDTGDWHRGFEPGRSFTRPMEDDGIEHAKASHEYYIRTQACTGYWSDILDQLEEVGMHPHRARVTVLQPGQSMEWHQDAAADDYCVRLHIPIITNPDCAYEVQDAGFVHMPADGYAHLVDAAPMHRAWNAGSTPRVHFLAQVWDTTGVSEHFVVTQSRKNIMSYHNMMGFHTFRKLENEREG